MILVAVVVVIVIVAPAAAAAAALTRKIPIPRRTGRKGKKLILKRNAFTRLTNIKENKIMTLINTNTLIRR